MLQEYRFAGTRPRCAALLAANLFAAAASAQVPQFDHVVVVVMENHSFGEIVGSASAPYINSLAAQGATFTSSFAIEHPSQPNYADLFSGANQGMTNDTCLVGSPLASDNLGSQLIAANFSFTGYSEDLPSAGSTICISGLYARKHNPWVNFSNVPVASNQPLTSFPSDFSTLPTLAFVIPNQCNDMHNSSGCASTPIVNGDTWLQAHLDDYAQWAKTHNSLLVLTWDEDDSSQSNQILTIFNGAMVIPGNYAETINHYSVLATLEAMYGLTQIGGAIGKTAITDVWDTTLFQDGFEP